MICRHSSPTITDIPVAPFVVQIPEGHRWQAVAPATKNSTYCHNDDIDAKQYNRTWSKETSELD